MEKPELLGNNFEIWDFNEMHNKHVCVPASASQRTQVRCIEGSYLMIYAYKTQDNASCKTLPMFYLHFYTSKQRIGICDKHVISQGFGDRPKYQLETPLSA